MEIRSLVKGLMTFIPGSDIVLPKRRPSGTNSAIYCYEVWLKHLTMLWANGLRQIPETVVELGPGDSIGVGLSALLSGVKNYYAVDVASFANNANNNRILDELVKLFRQRKGRPTKGWPDYDHFLDRDLFPSHILTTEHLESSMTRERIEGIRRALGSPAGDKGEISIKYVAPWYDPHIINAESVDVILSHAVMEHVNHLENAYQAMSTWLKPGGVMSHQIDFSSHGITKEWNGHRRYSEFVWKMVFGKRPFLINRHPCSVHINLIKTKGFKIICCLKSHRQGGISKSHLAPLWRNLSVDDLTCSCLFVQAQKER